MSSKSKVTVALLGQPNSGKSTVFNGLTGAKQKVGNWPGKTVEKKEGYFHNGDMKCRIMDLPGSYSLSANSDEEVITRDYIASEEADLVCILADASQLERSLYMLADYVGINTPAILLLNMVDVAENKGIKVNPQIMEKRLGIPVLPFVASRLKNYPEFKDALRDAVDNPRYINKEKLDSYYKEIIGDTYNNVLKFVPKDGVDQYSNTWIAAKLIENDIPVIDKIEKEVPKNDRLKFAQSIEHAKDRNIDGGQCKFRWIDDILDGAVERKAAAGSALSKFDRVATSRIWGKLIAIGIILGGLVLSMIVAMPIMGIGMALPSILNPALDALLGALGASTFVTSLVEGVLVNALTFTVSMLGFVLGILLIFGLIEQVGYMARVSYVFDNLMSKLGLQGKAIMPFLVSFGCTIGGVAGTRVIDSWGQRLLAITLTWAVPCAATFVVIPPLAFAFFGWGGLLVMILIFAVAVLHMMVTAKIFGKKLLKDTDNTGLVMELPPYHKPKWGTLIKGAFSKLWGIFKRAFAIILVVSLIFWVLSYSTDGVAANSILYKFGHAIEPVTRFFGMGWQTFLAFLASMMSKEAILGVMSALFMNTGSLFDSTIGNAAAASNISEVMTTQIGKPEALAFIFASTFNVPCIAALGATYQETHSGKWTAAIVGYYLLLTLILAFIMYHIGLLIF